VTDIVLPTYDLGSSSTGTVSPIAELVRVAVTGRDRQIDLSLPLDVPVALLVPEIVRLFSDGTEREDRPKDVVWALIRAASGASLEPGDTLRDAGVARDDVLNLRGRRTHAVPTLYDDVVDAAARLNNSGHPGWNPAAARVLAYIGIGLVTAAWVHLVVIDASSPRRVALIGLAAFAAVVLLVVATILARSGGTPQDGAALGWAAIPVAAAGCWAGLSPHGSLALAGAALALLLLSLAGYHLIGSGLAGFTASTVFFTCGAIALAAAGVSSFGAAVFLAVGATIATTAVPRLTARCDYSSPAHPDEEPVDADFEWGAARARSLRGGLYAGLAVAACVAATAAAWIAPAPSWPTWAFGVVCAAALGLPRPTAPAGVVRVTAGPPAVALLIAVALHAVGGDQPISVLGAAVLPAGAMVLAAVGAGAAEPRRRRGALLSAASYLAWALVVPTALWAVGAQAGWGVA
jgi:type VII secretion integral membrane protein EccD